MNRTLCQCIAAPLVDTDHAVRRAIIRTVWGSVVTLRFRSISGIPLRVIIPTTS